MSVSDRQELIKRLRAYDERELQESIRDSHLMADLQEAAALIDLLTSIVDSKGICGHWGSYAYSPDGKGAQIVCMQCRAESAERRMEKAVRPANGRQRIGGELLTPADYDETIDRAIRIADELTRPPLAGEKHGMSGYLSSALQREREQERSRWVDIDPTQAEDPHVDRLAALIEKSLRGGGCSNCGGLPHTTTCRVGRLARAFKASAKKEKK